MAKKRYSYDETHRTVKGVKQKRCTICKKWKDESEFCKNRGSRDGLQWQCKKCKSEYARKRYEQSRKGARRNLRYEDSHRVVNGVKQKLCSKCRRWKSESEFYKDRSAKDGLMYRCKKCSYKPSKSRKK